MRISTKLALGLTATSTLVLSLHGCWDLHQKDQELRGATEHDLTLLGTALEVAIENSIRDRQEADVREVLDALERGDSSVDVHVFDTDYRLTTGSPGSSATVDLARAAAHEAAAAGHVLVRFEGPKGLSHLVGAFPLRSDVGTPLGTLAVVRPLDDLRQNLVRASLTSTFSSVLLIAIITGIGWLLILVSVRRPLSSLVGAVQAVRGGDLSTTVSGISSDEVGVLADQFNAMVRELDEARRQLIAAAESREALEAGLQRIDKLVTVGQLSAGLAHEIGSPLQILSGRARSLAARSGLPADVVRTARSLEEQCDRITKIVEQLLSFARRKAPHMSRVELGTTVGVIVDLLDVEARRRGVRLQFECAAGLPAVTADADQVQQVALNLLSNALRATPAQGRVQLQLGPAAVATSGGPPEPAVCLSVEDSGAGMPEEVRRRAFEPFFTTWADNGGTGLGLAVVKSIVDEHGGTIEITSGRSSGTRVAVCFPVRRAGVSGRSA